MEADSKNEREKMSLDKFDRHTFIAFTWGICMTKGGHKLHDSKLIEMVDKYLVEMKQQVMTREEIENIIEQIDNMMYLFRLETSNRKQFRSVVR